MLSRALAAVRTIFDVIPRIDGTYYPHHRIEFPNPKRPWGREPSLFTALAPPLRKMVVMVDVDLLPNADLTTTPRTLLADLLSHPFIRCYRYSDAAPPEDPSPVPCNTEPPHDACIRLRDDTAQYWDGVRVHQEHLNLDPEIPDRHVADVRASTVAGRVGVDIFVTEREYLLGAKRWMRHPTVWHYGAPEPPCFNVRDSLALVALYLRSQGRYWNAEDSSDGGATGYTGKARFYRRAARAVVPAAWRLYALFPTKNAAPSVKRCGTLTSSLFLRLEFALCARDKVHQALNQSEDIYSGYEAFVEFDNCLVLLMGALDACAQIAHHILTARTGESRMNARKASWQNDRWLDILDATYPDLAAPLKRGSFGRQVLKILLSLRNTVHKESLSATGSTEVMDFGYRPLLRLPSAEQQEICRAIEDLGGEQAWGITKDSGTMTADPGMFFEQIFPRTMQLLNELIERMPLGDLPQLTLPSDTSTPVSHNDDFLRWQLGLD